MNSKFTTIAACLAFSTTAIFAQAKYDLENMQLEKLGRGVVAVRETPEKVAVSWRYLPSDSES